MIKNKIICPVCKISYPRFMDTNSEINFDKGTCNYLFKCSKCSKNTLITFKITNIKYNILT